MQITKIITSVNDNPTYRDFLPLVSLAWEKLFNLRLTVGYITTKNPSDPDVLNLSNHADIKVFPPISGVDAGVQAKVTRMYLASSRELANENCMIVDVDMIPLSAEVLEVFKDCPEDHLAKWGHDHPSFLNPPNIGKWPMDRTTAKGVTFREIINPKNLNYNDLIKSWRGLHKHGKEDVSLPFGQFSDESLLRLLYEGWGKRDANTHEISRLKLEKKILSRRLDRAYPWMWNNLKEKLKQKAFIELHGIRPLHPNLNYYRCIMDYFGITEEDILL
jgi:hypothetical protein|tara:strand:- start:2952 stop:3776 length:825 start_codon:yes stop_codon:yes gene_type:complete